MKAMRLGYDAEPVLFVNRTMRGIRLDSAASVALRNALVDKARAIPGVEAAAWIYSVPFRSTSGTRLFVAGIDTVAAARPIYVPGFVIRVLRDDGNAHPSRPSVHGRGPRGRPAGHGRQRIHGARVVA